MNKGVRISVLAFDPGGSTGVAYFRGVRIPTGEYLLTEYGSLTLGPEAHHSVLWMLLNKELVESDRLYIVTESFEYRNQARAGLELVSREYIGILRLFYDLYGNVTREHACKVEYHKQSPAQAKVFVKDDNLRKLTVWKKGKDARHEMDAQRHLFYYLIHTAKIMPEQFLRMGWKN